MSPVPSAWDYFAASSLPRTRPSVMARPRVRPGMGVEYCMAQGIQGMQAGCLQLASREFLNCKQTCFQPFGVRLAAPAMTMPPAFWAL